MYNYFAHDPEAGTEFFRTEEEAIAYCNDAIQDYREQAMEDCEWQANPRGRGSFLYYTEDEDDGYVEGCKRFSQPLERI